MLSTVVRIGHRFCHDNWMIHSTTGADTKVTYVAYSSMDWPQVLSKQLDDPLYHWW